MMSIISLHLGLLNKNTIINIHNEFLINQFHKPPKTFESVSADISTEAERRFATLPQPPQQINSADFAFFTCVTLSVYTTWERQSNKDFCSSSKEIGSSKDYVVPTRKLNLTLAYAVQIKKYLPHFLITVYTHPITII